MKHDSRILKHVLTGIERVLFLALAACAPPLHIASPAATPLAAPVAETPQDVAPREQPRLMPAEVYLRSYLLLSGAPNPGEAQRRARGGDGGALFDNWNDYLATLGFPDYRLDLPRAAQTNALMVAAFERLGIALCDRAVERDFKLPPGQRIIFAFEPSLYQRSGRPPAGAGEASDSLDEAGFAERFDVLHRTFLGYPAKLAPEGRIKSYFALYQATVSRHAGMKSRLSPSEAGWASVCYGLIRHPEYHLY
jgi:hypothetical protein